MKREILFRAWDLERKTYRNVGLWDNSMPSNWQKFYEIEQFTGLTDRNGVKIFEGDIMQHANPFYVPFIVVWNDESCGFEFNNGSTGYVINDNSFEVIGNIRQNAELVNEAT